MACTKIKSASGSIRLVPVGEAYTLLPGEKRVGISRDCIKRDPPTLPPNPTKELLRELDAELGEGAGNWVKSFLSPVAKLLGKANCATCETRRVILNAYARLKAKHGQAEALKMIGELWNKSFQENDEEVLAKLKEYLNA